MPSSRGRSLSRLLISLVGVTSGALVLSVTQTMPFAAPAHAEGPATASDTSADDASRPDSVSAMVTARASGHRVEDLSQHTDTTRVFANPDGTWTSESADGPAYVQDKAGQWHDVDPTLVVRDGHLAPAYATTDLTLSDGGDTTFASVTEDGKKVDFDWPTTLPTPVVDGNVATYPDAVPGGGDLVVTAGTNGFHHDIVLHHAPAMTGGGDPSWTIPVATHGAVLDTTKAGGLEVATKSGDPIVTADPPVMYDSAAGAPATDAGDATDPDNPVTDPVDDPATDVAPLEATVGQNAAGTPTMTLTADKDFLTDPATVYPVVIDPNFVDVPSSDTWIESSHPNQQNPSDASLMVGYNGTYAARSFLAFAWTNVKNLQGATIDSADLTLRNYSSLSCAGSAIRVERVTQPWSVSDGISWNNQPGFTTDGYAQYSPAHGGPNCTYDDAIFPMTSIVDYWAAHPSQNYGVIVKAEDETTTASWREYRSANYATASVRPQLSVTYNHAPSKPGTPQIATSPASNSGYSISATPTFKTTVSDPDQGQVRARYDVYQGSTTSGTLVSSGYSPYVSSGGTTTWKSGALTDGGTYTVKVTANDGTNDSTTTSTATFTVDTSKPATTITATGFTNDTWTQDAPTQNTFTFDGPADTKSFSYSLDGITQPTKAADASGDATITWLPKNGSHKLFVTATDKAGNAGPTATFAFGVGEAKFDDLGDSPQSTGVFPIHVEGPPGADNVELSWRYAGHDTAAWQPMTGLTTTDGDQAGTSSSSDKAGLKASSADETGLGATVDALVDAETGGSTTQDLLWDATAEQDPTSADGGTIAAPALLQIRACFNYLPSASQICSVTQQLQLVPSAFGGNFPTTTLGPATVALFTGEASYDEADAVDARAGVGRTFTSFDASTLTPGPFGPGWSATLGASSDSGAELIDDRAKDHTFVLVTAGDASQIFTPLDPDVDPTQPSAATGPIVFAPAGVDHGSRLTLSADGTTVTLTQLHGDTTVWTYQAPTDDEPDAEWALASADASGGQTGTTTAVGYNASGYPAWIAETAPGDTAACTATDQEPGCRGLRPHYTGTGAATRVDYIDQVTPTATTRVATYTYTSDGLLATACGPDPDGTGPETALCTTYGYDTTTVEGRTLLAQITPPGQATWTLAYDAAGRLTSVTRPLDPDTQADAGSGNSTWRVDYQLATTADGLPDLTAPTVAGWGQSVAPTHVAAVFGPDHPVTGTPTSADLPYAALWFTDADGNTTNTAVHGDTTNTDGSTSSGWLVDATWYDEHGNAVQTLDAAGLQAAQAAGAAGTAADEATVAAARSSYTAYSADGSRVEDEYGPVHTATLDDGTTGEYRSHTAYVYDDEAPDLGGTTHKPAYTTDTPSLDLVVEADTSAADPDMSGDHDVQRTRNRYDPIVEGDGNGWTLGTPTQTSVEQPDGTWAVTDTTRDDADGDEIETREPGGATNADGSGSDAHATVTSYYAKNAADPDCDITGHDDRAGWEGLECKTGPAGQPAGAPIPTTWTKTYDTDLNPTLTVETSGSTTRTTTTTYDALDRPTQTIVDDGHDTRSQTYTYDPATGQQASVTDAGSTGSDGDSGAVNQTYDSWGQVATYTDASGLVTSTTYNADGAVAGHASSDGTTTYDYDEAGADGGVENRGVVTSLTTTLSGSATAKFSFGYDADGDQTRVAYPNGMTSVSSYDETGAATGLSYAAADGSDLLDFTDSLDVDGNVLGAQSPESSQTYTYDALHRLTQTQDVRAAGCTTRDYAFSPASERTGLTTYGPADDGTCQTTTAAGQTTSVYDAASRITNAGYSYDDLGRTLTVPAADTSAAADPNAGPLSIGYYADDMVETLTQTVSNPAGGTEQTSTDYALDAEARIATTTNTIDGAETSRETDEYADDSDAPAITRTSTDGGTTWATTRYVADDTGAMVASVTGGTITYQLANLHGDVVATTTDTTGLAIDTYSETDEYGNPLDPVAGTYNYLGTSQRATGAVGGLTLMGARLYNPYTGTFLSPDSIAGGNATPYTYPQDPVNQEDLDGDGCVPIIHIGADCGSYITNAYGHQVFLKNKIYSHIYGRHGLPKYLIKFFLKYMLHDLTIPTHTATRKAYSVILNQVECNSRRCWYTGVQKKIVAIVEWKGRGRNRGTLATMYCVGGRRKCPAWVLEGSYGGRID